MKVAIVHDWLTNMGGAEKLVEIFHKLYSDAPVYTLIYDEKNMSPIFKEMDIRTSYLQYYPMAKKKHPLYLQMMPTAIEQFDLTDFDLVLSSSTSCAKGVITRADTLHICYCNTPMRYAWDFYHQYMKGNNWMTRKYIAYQMNKIRLWDRLASDRVDYYIANSRNVAKRIKKHYRRDAAVIYPPVDTELFIPNFKEPESYYLCAGRLVHYKRIDIAVAAFNKLNLPLWIAGDGVDYKYLKRIAGSTIKFLGRVNNDDLRLLYQGCKAFIFPGEEDFGITPLEAQACGRPVIAYRKGGALETVVHGETGVFFDEQSAESLSTAINYLLIYEEKFNSESIRKHAETFSVRRFEQEIKNFVDLKYSQFLLS